MDIIGTCVFVECNGFFCSSTRPCKRNSKSNSNKSCFILASESAFDFKTFPFFWTSANEINDDLKKIEAWTHQWKMSFNSDPLKQAQEVIF